MYNNAWTDWGVQPVQMPTDPISSIVKVKGRCTMYGPQVLPAFLPSTGSGVVMAIVAGVSIIVGIAVVISGIARMAAKRAYKA